MSIEAMKQALEALEVAANGGGVNFYEYAKDLRQAIAEASENGLYREGYRNGYGFGEAAGKRHARQTWVGLTDEDCKGMSAGDKVVAMWADRTLKEKNT